MNRIDALGLKFQDEASGRFHCLPERTTIQYSERHSTNPNSQHFQFIASRP